MLSRRRFLQHWILIAILAFVLVVIGASVLTALKRPGPLPAIDEGLLAQWVFYSNLGNRAKDSVGGHDGLIHNPSWVTGRGYLSLELNGQTTYIEIPPVRARHAMPLQDSFTIAAWVNPESRQRQVLLQKTDPSGDLRAAPLIFYAPWGEGRLGLVLCDGTRRVGFLSDGAIWSGRWQHVVVSLEDETGQIRFYIDGEPTGVRTTTVKPAGGLETIADTSVLLIGAARSTSGEKFHFQGELDSLSLYDRALTPEEVQALVLPR